MSDDLRERIQPTPGPERPRPAPAPEPDEDWPYQGEGPTPEERNLAVLCHVGGFFLWFIVPLIILASNKGKSRFVEEHAREALNLQIAVTIYYLVGCLTLVLWIPVLVYEIVVVIKAAVAASRGEHYRTPWNIRFIK